MFTPDACYLLIKIDFGRIKLLKVLFLYFSHSLSTYTVIKIYHYIRMKLFIFGLFVLVCLYIQQASWFTFVFYVLCGEIFKKKPSSTLYDACTENQEL